MTVRDADTGAVDRTWTPPGSLGDIAPSNQGYTSVDEEAQHIAYVDGSFEEQKVHVVDTASGETSTIEYDEEVGRLSVDYVGDHLLVSTRDSLEVWDRTGANLDRRFALGLTLGMPLADPTFSTIAYQRQDGRIVLLDVESGEEIGGFVVPAQVEGIKSGFAFDEDGTELVVVTEGQSGDRGQLQRWQISPEALVDSLCAASDACPAPSGG